MNWMPSNLGAEPKKVGALAGLAVLALVVYLFNRTPGGESSAPAPARPAAVRPASASGPMVPSIARPTKRVTQNGVSGAPKEFTPSIGKTPVDPAAIDPTLHLAALQRLQDVKVDGTSRSLFEISATPPVQLVNEPGKINVAKKEAFQLYGPKAPAPPPAPPPPPIDPPIPLKFYGFVDPKRPDIKRAFFMDSTGEKISIAGEGELIDKRYKIVRIGVNSAEVEDTVFKGNNTKQTLPLETEGQG